MSKYEMIGLIVVEGLALIGAAAVLIKPLINLNSTMAKLNLSLKLLVKDNDEVKGELKNHEERIADHEKRIYHIEHKEE